MQRSRRFLKALTTKYRLFIVASLFLAGCSTAPVQEMSDARQALRSAEIAGAAQHLPSGFAASEQLLQQAQAHLETGAYEEARRLALEARDRAIKVREQALQATPVKQISP